MANRKSSRINHIKYTYRINIHSTDHSSRINEYINNKYLDSWSIYELKGIIENFKDRIFPSRIKSFIRTQNWLKENHPEYMI